MNNAMVKDRSMDRKRVSISVKRQITIPQKFYTKLGFESEAECIIRGNEIVLRPVKNESGNEFSEIILEELIAKGYSGKQLLDEFKKAQRKIRPAVEVMLDEAERVATGESEGFSYGDVFDSEED